MSCINSRKLIVLGYSKGFFFSNLVQVYYECQGLNMQGPWHTWSSGIISAFVIMVTSSTFSAGNSPVSGEFPAQRPVTRSFDVFFDLRPNKQLSKQWWGNIFVLKNVFDTPTTFYWCDRYKFFTWNRNRGVCKICNKCVNHAAELMFDRIWSMIVKLSNGN